jgi:ABC-type multidrug transport system fused ATPase/permease subunit
MAVTTSETSEHAHTSTTWDSAKILVGAAWESTSGDRLRFLSFVILYILSCLIDLLVPVAIGITLERYVNEGFAFSFLNAAFWGVLAYIGLQVVRHFLHHYGRYLQGTAGFNARFTKLQQVFAAIIGFPLKWHVNTHSGENLSRLHRSVGAIEQMINNYSSQIIDGTVKFVFASIAIFAIDLKVATAVLPMGLATVLIMIMFNTRLTRNIRKNNRFYDRQNRTCFDYLRNIITVKTLRLEEPAVKYLTEQRGDGLRICRKIWKYQELKWGTVGIGYSLVTGTALLIYFSDHRTVSAPGDVAQIYILLNYLDRILGVIGAFTGYYSGIIEAATAYDDASSFLKDSAIQRQVTTPSRLEKDWESFTVKDLAFSYSGQAKNLAISSLTIKRGEKIALVGPSGGGKSTLLKVLGGMLSASASEVTTTPVTTAPSASPATLSLSLDDLAQASLLIPQEPEIFSETLIYNLTLGQEFTQEQLQKALEICRIDHLLSKLPSSWESYLEEAGLNISVGERQRLALARGVLRIPGKDILLLDEPTSSLDPMTEKQIFHGILGQFVDRVVITACHRLALVPLFDKIIYIREGKIEEIGTFPELRASGGAFAAAWDDYEKNAVGESGTE